MMARQTTQHATVLLVLLVVLTSCGGAATLLPSPTDLAQVSPTPLATTAAPSTASPSPTPTAVRTPAPTATADPTLVADVQSDADVERLFVGMTPDELKPLVKETADASYRFPLPFDPHGLRFQLRTQGIRLAEDAPAFPILGVVLLSGSAVVKLHGPAVYALRRHTVFGPEPHYLIVPTDQDVFRPGISFRYATRGVFVEVTAAGEILPPIKFGEVNSATPEVSNGLGMQVLRVDASMARLGGPATGVWPNSHLVIHGKGIGGYSDGAPMTSGSLLRAGDGRIVYIRCQLQFDGSKWVQVCPGG